MTNLPQLRLDLAAARITLRQAKDELETTKAIAETNMIHNGAAGGKNAEERARALTVALEGSTLYRDALSYLRESEASIDELQAMIANEEDRMRADELRVREKLADALLGRRESTAVDDDVLHGATEAYASRRNGRSELQQGQTADDVQWQQHAGTYDRPDTSDWYPER